MEVGMKKFLIVLAVLALVSFTLPACQTNQAKPEGASRAGMIERIGILCQGGGDCIEGWNGSTIKLYSDAGTTNRFSVDSGVGEVKIAAPTAIGTATPVVIISGGKSVLLEARNPAGTPVFAVNADGSATYTGFSSAGGEVAAAAAVAAPTAVGTATPAFYVNSAGVSNLFEARKNATPVFAIGNDGTISNIGTVSDELVVSNVAKVAGPTAATTATPAFVVDSTSADAVLFDVRKAATPVFSIGNAGAFTATGAGTYSSGQTVNNWAKVAAPTAIATATPALVIDSAGASNLIDARKNATPVFQVNGSGNTTVAGTLGITGSTTVGGLFLLSKQGNVTVTDGGEIAATKSFVPLTAAGAVGTSNITTGAAGQLLVLMNVGSNTITITDTGTIMLAGDCALGQYDTLTLISDGTNWLEITRANN